MSYHILVVDDEKNIRRTLELVLTGEGYKVSAVPTAEEGLGLLEREEIDLAVLDVKLPGMSGIDALKRIRERHPDEPQLPVVMISGHATVKEAVEAVQLGAADFFEKPIERDRVLISIRNSLEKWRLRREVLSLRARVEPQLEMIGSSEAMKRLFDEIRKVAPTKGRVLITGESGTGKELIARAVHRLSPRAEAPFVKVNCAAIPGELIESELFGYERGAFTGAQGRKRGQFELADGGTLFLDEIGDMSPSAQAKVLRALQSGEITRVGGESALSVDVRILAATNRALDEEVKAGRFREDLYFRLAVVPLHSPPLREHPEDIPLLVDTLVGRFCDENGFRRKTVEPAVLEAMMRYHWPGNVRELKNVVERMVILSESTIRPSDLPDEVRGATPVAVPASGFRPGVPLRLFREQAEKAFLLDALGYYEWNISRAAQALGIERTNLHKKIRGYGITRDGRGGSAPTTLPPPADD
ncbi:MAG: sigma-54-dependent Fis family transcriptional regulator [Deltaproteobacteria bacterium]|nr:sigma-54-dependent Fis family transcriptional regulator [Deltaproteobacteria bacterium]